MILRECLRVLKQCKLNEVQSALQREITAEDMVGFLLHHVSSSFYKGIPLF